MGLYDEVRNRLEQMRQRTQQSSLANFLRTPVQVSKPVANIASRLAQATPQRIISQGVRQNAPLYRQAASGFVGSSTFGAAPQIAPAPQGLAQKAAYGVGLAGGLFNPLNPVSKIAEGLKAVKPVETAFKAVQRPLGAAAGKLIAKGGAAQLAGKGLAAASQGLPLTTALAGTAYLSGNKFNPASDIAGNAAIGAILPGAGAAIPLLAGIAKNKQDLSGLLKHEKGINALNLRMKVLDKMGVTGYTQTKEMVQKAVDQLAPDLGRNKEFLKMKSGMNADAWMKAVVDKLNDRLNAAKTGDYTLAGLSTKAKGSIEEAQKQIDLKKSNNTQTYLQDLIKNQNKARLSETPTLKQKGTNLLNDIKKKFVDSTSPIEDLLYQSEKKNKFKVLPSQDIRLQIDRVLRAPTLAGQFVKDNGLDQVIKQAPNLDELNQYLIAKQASRISELGKQTGRDLNKDKELVQYLAPKYEPLAQKVTEYGRKLLDYTTDTGLIDKKTADMLKNKYPDYVPINRIFNEMEKGNGFSGSKAVASLSRQSVVNKLEGSTRQIEDPISSFVSKTADAFQQGEKNIAARQLASYRDLPGFKDIIHELKPGEAGIHTFSYLDNGVKKTFSTTPDIAAAAKSLDKEQIGLIGNIVRGFTRALQLGATGLNLPFAATNLVKDQVTAFVNSNHAAKTSLLNPLNFLRSMFSAIKHDGLYEEVVRNAAGGTSFDIARSAPQLTVKKIRSQKSLASTIGYTVRNPGELLRAVENLIGRTEELTRIQNYKGAYDSLINQGRTVKDAKLLAAQQARNNTANFARSGDWGKVLNATIPFFNAGIQGTRTFVHQVAQHPLKTGIKATLAAFYPIAALTAWNLSDPKRKEVYNDIQDYEKENNLIIIPPNPIKDEKGKWNVIKIPMSQELTKLGGIVRRSIESANGLDPLQFKEVAAKIIGAGTSLNTDSALQLVGGLTPQIIKAPVESLTNTNLFTGKEIVPSYMKTLPPEEQVKDYTSGTARKIGGLIGASPLKVQNAVSTTLGGVGSQLLNASDKALNKLGVIPKEQISGQTAVENLVSRFSKATGGVEMDKAYQNQEKQAAAKKKALGYLLTGKSEEAKKLIKENSLSINKDDIKTYQNNSKKKVAELIVDGKNESAAKLAKETGSFINNEDIYKAAKRKVVELMKLKLYKQASKIASQYKVVLTKKDLE